eukprot:754890-Hanusia_phi.AAC.2
MKKFRTFIRNRSLRRDHKKTAIIALWNRVASQRERQLKGARGLMSFWIIAWRIKLSEKNISQEKAKDLQNEQPYEIISGNVEGIRQLLGTFCIDR